MYKSSSKLKKHTNRIDKKITKNRSMGKYGKRKLRYKKCIKHLTRPRKGVLTLIKTSSHATRDCIYRRASLRLRLSCHSKYSIVPNIGHSKYSRNPFITLMNSEK